MTFEDFLLGIHPETLEQLKLIPCALTGYKPFARHTQMLSTGRLNRGELKVGENTDLQGSALRYSL